MAEKTSTSQADDDQKYKIRILYSDMVIHLSERISPDKKLTWLKLLTALDPLLPDELNGDDILYIGQILDKLRAKGKIDRMRGSFEELYYALRKVDVEAAGVVNETSIKIKALLSEGPPAAKKPGTERDGNQIRAKKLAISTHKQIIETQEDSEAAFIDCKVDPCGSANTCDKKPKQPVDEGYYQCTAEANGKSADGDVVKLKSV
ncbi:uncharacterized protein LOC117320568, partial [Pecten maximus]|uniref:uncharacterized protein LOC117320568 n=1 Tax=Pecten maximus TaxID=6579 RepID=UPI0014590FC2